MPVPRDLGGNFKKGSETLKLLTAELYKDKERLERHHCDTVWEFVPPLTPWMGGVYERVVQYAKKAIDAVLPHHGTLDTSELETIVVIAEGILNNRPLGYMPNEAGNRAVTPNMFISPGVTVDLVPLVEGETLGKRFARMQAILDGWWEVLVQRMRAYFVSKQKVAKSHHNLQAGDVVLVLDSKVRGRWSIGRIEKLLPGKDGKARSVEVLVRGKVLVRAAKHLAPLAQV